MQDASGCARAVELAFHPSEVLDGVPRFLSDYTPHVLTRRGMKACSTTPACLVLLGKQTSSERVGCLSPVFPLVWRLGLGLTLLPCALFAIRVQGTGMQWNAPPFILGNKSGRY